MIKVNPEWWKDLFDDVYLKTDARSVCDEKITGREVDVVCQLLPMRKDEHILDLCGGQGRHSLELSSRGFTHLTVLDYSPYLIELGKRTAKARNCGVSFLQGDARHTGLQEETFDHVLILGNSFGYQSDPEDDRRILAEAHRLLKPGQWLLVDVADGARVCSEMVPNAWHVVDDDLVVCRERELEGSTVLAREMVFSKARGLVRDQTYAIRVFGADELVQLIKEAGFVDVRAQRGFAPHGVKGDFGFMDNRILATGIKQA